MLIRSVTTLNLKNLIDYISAYIGFSSPIDLIRAFVDIGIVAYVFYKSVMLLRETRAWQLVKGVIFILVAAEISKLLELRTISYILNNTISILTIAILVVFQPELRRGLEQIGRSRFSNLFNFEEESNLVQITASIEEIVKAATEMSKEFIGALIVIERETKLGEVIKTGTQLESNISAELLINIFTPNTPLHDGAVVIRNNKIQAAGCFLPLTDNPNLSKELGTRHRAALGITEVSDSIAVIVSEETGKISFALNGGLTRNLTPDILRKALNKNLLEKKAASRKLTLWKVKKNE